MNLRAVETFVALARLGNFRAVAESMNTTQPAVSARIKVLENDLGISLFVRDSRGVRLTAEGVAALVHAESVLRAMRAMRERPAVDGPFRGTIRIGAIDAIVQTWLPRLIDRLRSKYPGVGVEISNDTSFRLARQLDADETDIAFSIQQLPGEQFDNTMICRYAMGWVASPSLIATDRTLSVAELSRLPMIVYPPGTPPYRLNTEYFGGTSTVDAPVNSSNSLSSMIRLVLDGLGVAAIPPNCVEREIREGSLLVIPVEKPFPPLPFYASIRSSRRTPLVDAVLSEAADIAAGFSIDAVEDR
ncbi:LysR family transcriptional regulator [Fodinicurvata sp. EGI_FJ10296]|uniref:LysR family transcriptional regulator n=1 Tax=Fodinicurvata sp. EGI_FJ10296 TaxID=3231908 RepID=UPI003451A308